MSINRFFITTLLIIGIPIFGLCQNYETLLSNIFFHADLSKQDTSILSFFAKDRRIVYSSEIEMWNTNKKKWYGFDDKAKSLREKNPRSPYVHTFAFYTNPFFKPPFGKGFITVLTHDNKGKQEVSELFLSIFTYDIAAVDSTFKVLNSLFSKYTETKSTDTFMTNLFKQYEPSRHFYKSKEVELRKDVSFKQFVPRATLMLIVYYDSQSYQFFQRGKIRDTTTFKK